MSSDGGTGGWQQHLRLRSDLPKHGLTPDIWRWVEMFQLMTRQERGRKYSVYMRWGIRFFSFFLSPVIIEYTESVPEIRLLIAHARPVFDPWDCFNVPTSVKCQVRSFRNWTWFVHVYNLGWFCCATLLKQRNSFKRTFAQSLQWSRELLSSFWICGTRYQVPGLIANKKKYITE